MKALRMSMAQDMKSARLASEKLHSDAVLLVKEFPHTGPVRNAMWAISKVGLSKCRDIASKNLSAYHFRKVVAK